MKIVVAPNAFKGSLDGFEAAEAMRAGILKIVDNIDVKCKPVADGGDGLIEVLAQNLGGKVLRSLVHGPLPDTEVNASFCYIENNCTAIIEMAKASGLVLIEEHLRDPELTTTFGTGQLIMNCLDLKAEKLIVGLGGSATCDGGIGAAAAVGYRFLDKLGKELSPIGKNLQSIKRIDSSNVDSRIRNIRFECICDVVNPFFGENGASYVYSPQKGADEKQVKELDRGLENLAEVIHAELGLDISGLPGAGAAGGLGGGMKAFFNADLKKGIDLVLDLIDLHSEIEGADLVITGEGRIDNQTQFDKAPAGVAKLAKKLNVPCVAICGSIGEGIDDLYEIGMTGIFSICSKPMDLHYAMSGGAELLADATEQVVRTFFAGK